MRKLIATLLMSTTMIFAGTYSGGSGTSANPYQINNLNDLQELSTTSGDWNRYFIQTAEINAGTTSSGSGFSPIGNYDTKFTGEYNGQGHTIDALYINRSGTNYIGLFGRIEEAVIDSIGLTNVDINGYSYVGGLVGDNRYTSTITNSYSTGSVSGSGYSVGGLVGYNYYYSTITNSYSTGSVSGSGYSVGGLVGDNRYTSTITNSYSTGSVSGDDYVGGLVGDNYHSTITNSYSTGSVSSNGSYVGGLVGKNDNNSTVSNSFWDMQTSGQSSSVGGVGKTTAEMTNLDLSSNLFYTSFWDFVDSTADGTDDIWNQGNGRNDDYPYLDWQYPSDFLGLTGSYTLPASTTPSGSGIEWDPYQIATMENLHWLSKTDSVWSKDFIQILDIDVEYEYMKNWEGGQGFSPIGNKTTQFTGKYNGQGHTIDSLYIDRSNASFIGLFGYTYGAAIDSIGLTNVEITGYRYVGGLVGWNRDYSTITNSYSTGSVSGSNDYVGGLVGWNIDNSTITNSYSTGSVSGNNHVGGLIGHNHYFSTITNSYSTGNVSGNDWVGGLVGYNSYSRTTNSYSTVDVTRSSGTNTNFGGFVGYNPSSTIEYCYSTGSVYYIGTADPTHKGFDGYNLSGTYSDNFFDSEASNQISATGATAKTTAEMTDLDLSSNVFYENSWDFVDSTENGTDDNWNQGNSRNDNYPYLAWQYPSDPLGLSGTSRPPTSIPPSGSGTEENPYQIATMANLYWLSQTSGNWNKYFIQTADIDVEYEDMKNWEGGQGFSPIGNYDTQFTGEYNGQGHTIDSLYINRPSTYNVGLFGYIDGAVIDSIGVTNVDIRGYRYVSGLVGLNGYNSTITNSYSTGSVSGDNSVGGLVGRNYSHSTISNSYSTGSVSVDNYYVGGLVGRNDANSTITNSYSTGSVSGTYSVGGLVGDNNNSAVSNSFWDMQTSGQSSSGGGAGRTTTEMTDLDLSSNLFYANFWDFVDSTADGTDDIWNQGNGRNDGYPYLDWQYPSDSLGLSGSYTFPTSTLPSGSGTEVDPYQIATMENLYWLSRTDSVWSKNFIQISDIDVDYEYMKNWAGGQGFSPIGNTSTQFRGKYNGQGHTIDSLYIDRSGANYIGLFGYTEEVVIDSIGLTSIDIAGYGYVGGLVGWNNTNSTITNSYSTGSVSSDYGYAGGLVGYNTTSTIINSYSTGSVSGSRSVGGLVGDNRYNSTITNSYSTGSVSGLYVGGLVGDNNNNSTVSNSFWDMETSGQSSSGGGAGRTTVEMKDLDLSSNLFYASFWDFVDSTANGTDDIWNQGNGRNDGYPYLDWQYPNDALGLNGSYTFPTSTPSSGSGTEWDPYQIETMENLYWLSRTDSVLSKNFIQTADIDVDYEYMKNWEGRQGFSPIGNNTTNFTGGYNGQGYTIDALYIDRPNTDNIGLFGYTEGAVIYSIGLTNVDIAGYEYVGGLVGYNRGTTVTNSYSTGSVSGTYSVGGLVGENDNSPITNSYSTGSVSGSSSVGGLVGYNYYYSTITNSYSTGSVSGIYDYIGGLVGYNYYYSTITNSYSTGSVSGGCGCYNDVGGFVGCERYHSTVSNSFWDTETSGHAYNRGGTGMTTAEMKDVTTFTDVSTVGLTTAWDFVDNPNDDNANDDIWKIDSLNPGYPYLSWQDGAGGVITIPKEFSLKQNYPNPFNPTTTIAYQLPKSSRVQLAIYNVLGQRVKILVNEKQDAGKYQVVLNGSNLSSGVYFYRLQTDKGFSKTRKLVLLK